MLYSIVRRALGCARCNRSHSILSRLEEREGPGEIELRRYRVASAPERELRDPARGVIGPSRHHDPPYGADWVVSVVNAVDESSYWRDTAIIVSWDDWGGFYDRVLPTIVNAYSDGFRVPPIVISPYARVGYVSHKRRDFGSILQAIEVNSVFRHSDEPTPITTIYPTASAFRSRRDRFNRFQLPPA